MAGIDNVRSNQLSTATQRGNSKTEISSTATQNDSKTTATGSGQDSVSLSQQSKALNQMQQDLSSQPAFDKAKVASIKEAIANGSYKVDPDKLASNILKFESELSTQ
ncbi:MULTISPECIES: flagellar biosynthesis anti-sigma factor FlgM [unclassified Vibrio]|uniref:Negative regulator of flagellin synthesis n=1 Tax=Vibrio sp. HB236076 TaxID=3232307 RepID=A0AB39HE88_9VIBR|nr:flagellar biosynthesis anti-sigma factor FlgM [Vibrio sp. HB161653]MDP5254260.1 flagellar biosynthesis anti-sigma factor FlgM [Vibrio sp. HB161653]